LPPDYIQYATQDDDLIAAVYAMSRACQDEEFTELEFLKLARTAWPVFNLIKEQTENPKTSTAFGKRGQQWWVARFVRNDDKKTMPVTFGPELAGPEEQLLINTAVMLIDLDPAVWDGFAFEQPATILKTSEGLWEAVFEPEDWRMSRYLADRGHDYAATWAVKVAHHGLAIWPNWE
jgi:hypothetical protein